MEKRYVKCIDNSQGYQETLTVGKEYEYDEGSTSKTYVYVKKDDQGNCTGGLAYRFTEPYTKPESKIEDIQIKITELEKELQFIKNSLQKSSNRTYPIITEEGDHLYVGAECYFINEKMKYERTILGILHLDTFPKETKFFSKQVNAASYCNGKEKESSPVLFTTEDGVGIKIGDLYWMAATYKNEPWNYMASDMGHCGKNNDRKYFSTEAAAKEWLAKQEDKILFRTADGVNVIYGDTYYQVLANNSLSNIRNAYGSKISYVTYPAMRFKNLENAKNWVAKQSKVKKCILGSSKVEITIDKEHGVCVNGVNIFVPSLKAIINNLDYYNMPDLGHWKTKIDTDVQFIKVGCSHFSLNELQTIVNYWNEVNV